MVTRKCVLPLIIFAANLHGSGTLPATILLSSSANPSVLGQPLTLTAAMTPSLATGSVTFYDGITILGTTKLAAGRAALATSLLPSGPHSFRAYYSGDSTYAASTSAVLAQSITDLPVNVFGPPVNYVAGSYAVAIAVGDFNGDGKADLVTANYNSDNITVLIGNGDGTFQPAVSYAPLPGWTNVTGLVIADFNGDGETDLAVCGVNSSQIAILLGNGDGTFQSAVGYSAANVVYTIVVADFNGDGKADIAAGTETGVAVLLGNGDGTFEAPLVSESSIAFTTIAVGDFNGDGKPDLVGDNGDNSGDNMRTLLGNGDGTFTLLTTPAGPPGAFTILVADLNGDGKPDLIVTGFLLQVVVELGNGDGTFNGGTGFGSGSAPPLFVAVGDVNGDGIPDLAVGLTFLENDVIIALGNGDGSFRTAGYSNVAVPGGFLVLADLNGDGRIDLIAANPNSSNLAVALGAPAIATTIALASSQNPSSYEELISLTATVTPAADSGTVTIKDGASVLATTTYSSAPITLNESALTGGVHSLTATYSGDATYAYSESPVLTQVVNRLPTMTTLASVNNPASAGQNIILSAIVSQPVGVPQVAFMTGQVAFMEGSTALGTATLDGGSASLVLTGLPVGPNVLTAVYSGDTNYTGSTSASLTETVVPAVVKTTTTTSLISSANPTRFGQSFVLTATVSPSAAGGTVTFYDGLSVLGTSVLAAGQASLIASQLLSGAHPIRAAYNGNASYLASTSAPVPHTIFSAPQAGVGPAVNYGNPSEGSYGVVTADFNGDGRTDLAFSSSEATSVMLGNGDGTFQSPLVTPFAGRAAVGDFNGDGKPDLVINIIGNVVVFLGNGDGTFRQAGEWSNNLNGPMVVADFNRDGKADVAIGNAVLLGNGDGTFLTELTSGLTSSEPFAAGDFNGDGIVDLVVSSPYGGGISLGNGDGTFQPPSDQGFTLPRVQSIAVGDFNADGKVDIATAFSDGTVAIYLGNGDGTLLPLTYYIIGTESISVAAADFNGDGKIDLVVGNFSTTDGYAAVLLGNGDGTFQTPQNYPTSSYLDSLAVGDFNGDGRADLAVGNAYGPVGVLMGTAPSKPSEAGIFRDNFEWILDANGNRVFDGTGPGEDYVYNNFIPALPGDVPVVGDWSGSGTTKIGIYRPSTGQWFLDYNGNGIFDAGDKTYNFGGIAGDIPVVGDWTGSGTSKIGIFRSGFFWILDINGDGAYDTGDQAFAYGGVPGDVPVTGDWSGNGVNKVGVVRPFQTGGTPAFWLLDANNDHAIDSGDLIFAFGGIAGDVPVVGDWNGSGFSKAGVYREGFYWVVDNNGSAPLTLGSSQVVAFAFGGVPGDVPVTGKW